LWSEALPDAAAAADSIRMRGFASETRARAGSREKQKR